MLKNFKNNGMLAVDISDKLPRAIESFVVTTTQAEPAIRNAFIIVKYENDYKECCCTNYL